MKCGFFWLASCAVCVPLCSWAAHSPAVAADKYTVKTEDTPPPAELSAAIRALLDSAALSVYDTQGKLLCTVWPRSELKSSASAEQVQSGLSYRELEETVVVGAVRFPEVWGDYRKQKIKPGVYTLRLGWQPNDGDHQGTAPFNEFCLLVPSAKDESPELVDPQELHQKSGSAAGGSHPAVMLLYPNPKPSEVPSVVPKPDDAWVLNFQRPVNVAGQKAVLGFGLVVIGHSLVDE